MNKKKKFMSAVCISACMLTLVSCGNKADKILGYVDKMDFAGALDYYDDKVDGSSKEKEIRKEVKHEMEDKYEKILEKYNNGEIDSKDLEDLLEFVEELKLDNDDFREFMDKISELKDSKDYYKKALDYIEDEQYSDAVYYLGYVIEEDSNYKKAQEKKEELQEKMLEESLEGYEDYLAENNYKEAKNVLDRCSYEYSDNEKYKELCKELDEKVVEYSKSEIQTYFENDEYDEAEDFIYSLYNYYFDDNDEMKALYNNLEADYVDFVVDKAETEAKNKNSAEAAAILKNAIENVIGNSNDDLNSAYEKYKAYLPVYIADLTETDSTGYAETSYSNTSSDIFDNKYKSAYYYVSDPFFNDGDAWAAYDIAGAYDKFTGTIAPISTYSSVDDKQIVQVFADDALVYTSPEMTNSTKPVTFDIDVKGKKTIKIVYVKGGTNTNAVFFEAAFSKADGSASTEKTTEATTEAAEEATTEAATTVKE